MRTILVPPIRNRSNVSSFSGVQEIHSYLRFSYSRPERDSRHSVAVAPARMWVALDETTFLLVS
jgi:hypothetical protein